MEYGYGTDTFGTYTSIELERDGGWRDHSDGEISRFYTNYGFEKDSYDINFSFIKNIYDHITFGYMLSREKFDREYPQKFIKNIKERKKLLVFVLVIN